MFNIKKLGLILAAVFLTMTIAIQSAYAGNITINLGHGNTEGSAYDPLAKKFAELAEKYTPTNVTLVHHYPHIFSKVKGKTYNEDCHTCTSYNGSSGSPLYDCKGRVMGIHESWDDETEERFLITCETLREVFKDFEITC